jgi:4-amino-4-deoxychorismate lyase
MFARGDGVFETLLVRGGRACLLDAHLTRLARSAAIVGLPGPDLRRWRTAAVVGAEHWTDASEGVLRLVYGRARGGPTGFVTVSGLPPRVLAARRDGVSAMTLQRGATPADEPADGPWSIAGAKSLSYAVNAAALRHAERLGVGDVVFTSADGFVLEGPRSSVLIADADGVLLTPPSTLPILPGTTVQAVFDAARAHGRPYRARLVHLDELLAAEGVWLLSSVTLAARVHTLDGVRLPAEPVASEVAALVDEAVGGTR